MFPVWTLPAPDLRVYSDERPMNMVETGMTITVAAVVAGAACLTAGVWHWHRRNRRAQAEFVAWVSRQGGTVRSVNVKYAPSIQSNLYAARWTDAHGRDQTTEFAVGLLGPVKFTPERREEDL